MSFQCYVILRKPLAFGELHSTEELSLEGKKSALL